MNIVQSCAHHKKLEDECLNACVIDENFSM